MKRFGLLFMLVLLAARCDSLRALGGSDGYLRKVKAIRKEGDGMVIETFQASLPEAISEGSLNATGELTPADLRSSRALVQVIFTVSATKLNGVLPKADIYTGQYNNLPYFSISVPNTTIQFF